MCRRPGWPAECSLQGSRSRGPGSARFAGVPTDSRRRPIRHAVSSRSARCVSGHPWPATARGAARRGGFVPLENAPMPRALSSINLLDPQQVAALNRLQRIGQAIAQNTERIQTLRRINSAKDDPAGLVSASRLEAELDTLEAVSTGLSRATAIVDTAATTAGKIADQLVEARSLALAATSGTLSSAEVAANQTQLDSILRTINTLSATELNGRRLLDGSSGFSATGVDTAKIRDVEILDKQTAGDVAV
ncbi:MAG: flagellin, partial [Thermoleophilia bacterium]|nr:flagellin [Thermoleophilia bacterium]